MTVHWEAIVHTIGMSNSKQSASWVSSMSNNWQTLSDTCCYTLAAGEHKHSTRLASQTAVDASKTNIKERASGAAASSAASLQACHSAVADAIDCRPLHLSRSVRECAGVRSGCAEVWISTGRSSAKSACHRFGPRFHRTNWHVPSWNDCLSAR